MALVDQVLSDASDWVTEKVPYGWGQATQAAADCSGAINRWFLDNGISLGGWSGTGHGPTSEMQATYGTPVALAGSDGLANAAPGDPLFFDYEGPNSHVGIYAGGGMMYDEPEPGRTAEYVPVDTAHLDAIRSYLDTNGNPAGPGIATTSGGNSAPGASSTPATTTAWYSGIPIVGSLASAANPGNWVKILSEVALVLAGVGLVGAGLFKATNPGKTVSGAL